MKQKHEDNHGFETVPRELNESPKLLEKMNLELTRKKICLDFLAPTGVVCTAWRKRST